MTARHDLDRVLTAWLTDQLGPVEAPSYFGETLDLIDRTPQRRAWPWSGLAVPRRWTRIDLPAGAWALIVVMLLLIAIVVAALIGALRLPTPSGPGRIAVIAYGDVWSVDPGFGQRRLEIAGGSETMPSWSPDGTRVAVWTFEPDSAGGVAALSVVSADGSGSVTIADGFEPRIPVVEAPAQWAADGRSLVFASEGQLFRVALDGTLTRIPNDGPLRRSTPIASPDGEWLAFVASTDAFARILPPIGSLRIVRADGSDETLVSGETPVVGGNGLPAWSADGRSISYVARVGEADAAIEVATLSDSGWTQRRFAGAPPPEEDITPRWDPVRMRLGYQRLSGSLPDGTANLQLTVIDEGGAVRLLQTEPLGFGFCWSPDGTRVATASLDQSLIVVDVDSGGVVTEIELLKVGGTEGCTWSAAAR
jgi:dipeptidyl aminopeptidase/acylaminoacyl peptidase